MSSVDPRETLRATGVVPVVALPTADAALPLCEALLEGNLPIVEITFRTPAAAEAIALITREMPEMCVGAGTVIHADEVAQARDSGARFGVSPGLNPGIVQHASELGLPFWPGVCTPSEIDLALGLGQRLLKFFPARALGGPSTVAAMLAPFLHLGVEVIPTGGIDQGTVADYWRQPGIAAVGGTWIAPKDLVEQNQWAEIANRARTVVDLWQSTRTER